MLSKDYFNIQETSQLVSRKLITEHITITSAESLTAGMFQSMLGNTPGISSVFPGGFVTYSNEVKHRILGISHSVIKENGVVSKLVALQMAIQSRKIMHTDLSISFTGAAGPSPLEGHPGGTVWIGIAIHNHSYAKLFHFNPHRLNIYFPLNHRNLVRLLTVRAGFIMINNELKNLDQRF